MERRNVHACHAGALVHTLEKWTHHEVRPATVVQGCAAWPCGDARPAFPARLKGRGLAGGGRVGTACGDAKRRMGCWAQVGAIDPGRIDLTWDAAIRHGFRLAA